MWKTICVLMEIRGFTDSLNTFVMVLTHGAVLSGCTGIELICREEWSAVALATAAEAPQTAAGDTRNPIVKFILAKDQGTLWLAISHTRGSNQQILSMHFVLLIFKNIYSFGCTGS